MILMLNKNASSKKVHETEIETLLKLCDYWSGLVCIIKLAELVSSDIMIY